ncbi:hypothetical protein I552_7365 [Mycobacterium xenopi 3993]|nr:hypothetical protein I552_7365 [Mycobacterium xenopi 3993]
MEACHPAMVRPPLTLTTWPVMNDAASEAKNSTGPRPPRARQPPERNRLDQSISQLLGHCCK